MKRFFIHPDLDDLPLKLGAFRVYCHLLRRAGKNGIAMTSADTICDSIGMDRKTVFKTLAGLEDCGLIDRWKPFGGCNRFRVPWPPTIVPKNGTIGDAGRAVIRSKKWDANRPKKWDANSGNNGTGNNFSKESKPNGKRGAAAVTRSASAACDQRPQAADTDQKRGAWSISETIEAAMTIRELEFKNDESCALVIFPAEEIQQWSQEWLIKAGQKGWDTMHNPQAALRGYLIKTANANSKRRFRSLTEVPDDEGEPPF
jgi:hypothetical protein